MRLIPLLLGILFYCCVKWQSLWEIGRDKLLRSTDYFYDYTDFRASLLKLNQNIKNSTEILKTYSYIDTCIEEMEGTEQEKQCLKKLYYPPKVFDTLSLKCNLKNLNRLVNSAQLREITTYFEGIMNSFEGIKSMTQQSFEEFQYFQQEITLMNRDLEKRL